ncbi:MAG: class I SAM-dependent methyltransferase [Chitinophagaceae bacterium]|nr:class I SAM-dependent methyltransferase [Bacteroidota bacterium]MCC6257638.1 class I SAM-dependent methyltransferase [Chitinophagaceae bacterium]MCW5916947.1 class I SAM-dependent methyltransferase [Ferruginibacter sp.]
MEDYTKNYKSPKYHVKKYLDEIRDELMDKIVLDIPAGTGVTTQILLNNGARPVPFDLFPEYFTVKGLACRRADITDHIPVEDGYAYMVICQEGIEHFSDQVKTFKEFNRVLQKGGKLFITTPSYSNLSARFSYFLFESENNKKMPPNEIDDIWMSDKSISNEIYHGHIFLVGLQKLRTIGRLTGFSVSDNKYIRISKGSLFLFPFFYPIIFISSWLRYFRNLKKNKEVPMEFKKAVYGEQLKMNVNPKNLLNRHTFIVFEKEKNAGEVDFRMESTMKSFEKTT